MFFIMMTFILLYRNCKFTVFSLQFTLLFYLDCSYFQEKCTFSYKKVYLFILKEKCTILNVEDTLSCVITINFD